MPNKAYSYSKTLIIFRNWEFDSYKSLVSILIRHRSLLSFRKEPFPKQKGRKEGMLAILFLWWKPFARRSSEMPRARLPGHYLTLYFGCVSKTEDISPEWLYINSVAFPNWRGKSKDFRLQQNLKAILLYSSVWTVYSDRWNTNIYQK